MKPKQATIIYNPVSGRNVFRERRVRKMMKLLESRGISTNAAATSGPNTGASLAREAISDGSDVIICHGGDGTLNEVLPGVARSNAKLAVWAGGTANVTARDLKMPRRLDRVADVIAQGKTMRISLGIASNNNGSRYFLMFAGIGLDASICRGVNPGLKRLTGQIAFWVSGIKHLIAWRERPFLVTADNESYESGFSLVANGKGYGGGILMAPGARLEEPDFQVFIMPRGLSRLAYIRALVNGVIGRSAGTGGRLVRATNIAATGMAETWVQVDGEPIGTLPMRFSIVPKALSIIVP
jgi:YegS/Rv2252/BmrU family lipid kinase